MKIIERYSDHGATKDDLYRIEHLLGAKLPQDYKDFLATANGGVPDVARFKDSQGKNVSAVRFFLTADPDHPSFAIAIYIDRFDERIPLGTLLIARDSFGNLVLLDVGSENHGAVYFWDHENESMDEEPWWDNTTPLAATFSAFTSNLY